MSLREYIRKRDFAKTREPHGVKGAGGKAPRFVIQKHAASRLHYDFRLELGGTLKSWAVPKGIPFAKGEKRLAVQVEDHPLGYAEFEGTIPRGQYGGGTVMVWDTGSFEPLGDHPLQDLNAGKLHFVLRGKKLKGEWTLVKVRGSEENQWLLIKSGEDVKPVSRNADDQSALSGRSMAAISKARDAVWQSHRAPRPSAVSKPVFRNVAASAKAPAFIEPMKAKTVAEPPRHGDWLYELKFDGYRALALKNETGAQIFSRTGKDFGSRFPEIAEAVAALPTGNAIIDGEIVALDEQGRSSFQLLQAMELTDAKPPLAYYVFDLPRQDGEDLASLPLVKRKARLKKLVRAAGAPILFSANIEGDPRELLRAVKARGLEGIIGKRSDSRYEPGKRSGAWIKLKCSNEQEFVIGGYTLPEGTRKHFGALLVGYHEGAALKFAGKVGTGFDARLLAALHRRMESVRREKSPFANLPEKQAGRWTQNITPAGMKRCRWSDPVLVCQIRFTEWTRDGKLRHPVFAGLREDKEAREVVRETSSQ